MSIWKGFVAPLAFYWNHSNVLAPARNIIREGGHWTDYLCAAIYLVLLNAVFLLAAHKLSTEFLLSVAALLAIVVALKYAWHYLS